MQTQLGGGWSLMAPDELRCLVPASHTLVFLQLVSPSLCTWQLLKIPWEWKHSGPFRSRFITYTAPIGQSKWQNQLRFRTGGKLSPSPDGSSFQVNFKRTDYEDGNNRTYCKLSNPKSIQQFSPSLLSLRYNRYCWFAHLESISFSSVNYTTILPWLQFQ